MTDVLITPASGKIEFKDATSNIDGKIELDASGNLNITSPGGDLVLGDTTSDLYIGNGVSNIDVVFEQNGSIRGTAGVTVTLGASGSNIAFASDLNLLNSDLLSVGHIAINNSSAAGRFHIVNSVSDQTASPDSSTLPDTTLYPAIVIDGAYTDGKYRTRLTKIDRSANLPLYVQESRGTANSYTNVARFGTHSQSVHAFEVFGSIRGDYLEATGGVMLRHREAAWTYTPHDIIYNSFQTTLGDYVYLKAAGNSASAHGIIAVADNGFYIGNTNNETGGLTNSATDPLTSTWARIYNGGATFGGLNYTGQTVVIEASNTAGAPAASTLLKMIGYEGRGIGTKFEDVSYSGEEWFAGMPYSGAFNAFQIGYDAAGNESEYAANSIARFTSAGEFQMGTTTVIDASRNLTNIANITAAGTINLSDIAATSGATTVLSSQMNASNTAASTHTNLISINATSEITNTTSVAKTASTLYGLKAEAKISSYSGAVSGTIDVTNMYGIHSSISAFELGGSVAATNAYAAYLTTSIAGGADFTNLYGLYIDNPTSSLDYAIYSSSGKNYFGGSVSIGAGSSLALGPEIYYPSVAWGASGSSTGCIIIELPGTSSNYDMLNMEIEVYEYNATTGSKILIAGHNWTSGWQNDNVQVIGDFPKSIYLGRDGTKYYIQLGETTDTWSYGMVHVTKVVTATWYNVQDWLSGWDIYQTTTEPTYLQKTTSFNTSTSETLRTPGRLDSAGINISGTNILTSSRNLTNIGTISSGNITSSGDITATGYLQATSYLYTRNNLRVLNAAETGWNTWATRSNGNYNLNVGTISSGAISVTDSGGSFKSISISAPTPSIYFSDSDVGTTNAWHLGQNGALLYVLQDTDRDGAYEQITAYWDSNNNYVVDNGYIRADNGYYVGTTQVIDSNLNAFFANGSFYVSTSETDAASRTTPIDVLTLHTDNTGAQPYTGFGQGLIFKGRTYNNSTQRALGRIVNQINDSSIETTRGTSMSFQTIDNPASTNAPTTKLELTYDGNTNVKNSLEINGTTVIDSSRNLTNINKLSMKGGSRSDTDEGTFHFWQIPDNGTNTTTWYKIADVSISTGLYKALHVSIQAESTYGNFGNTVNHDRSHLEAVFYRSGGTQDDQNNAQLYGKNPESHVFRILKTATGVYELQVQATGSYRYLNVKMWVNGTNGGTFQVATTAAAGSTTGTVYSITAPTENSTHPRTWFSRVSASALQINGTDVINSSRNLVNIGTISSGVLDVEGSTGGKKLNYASNFAASGASIQITLERTTNSTGWGGIGADSTKALNVYNSSTQPVLEARQDRNVSISAGSLMMGGTAVIGPDRTIYTPKITGIDSTNNTGWHITTDATNGGRSYLVLDSDWSDGIGVGSDYTYIGSDYSNLLGDLNLQTGGIKINNTTVIDTSRNLFNIASGNIYGSFNFYKDQITTNFYDAPIKLVPSQISSGGRTNIFYKTGSTSLYGISAGAVRSATTGKADFEVRSLHADANGDQIFLVENSGLAYFYNTVQTPGIQFYDGTNSITASMLSTDTLSFSGDSGQLFSITDSLSGTIFAVNDISGVPSIEVDDDGTIRLAETFGNVLIGTAVDDGVNKLQLNGSTAINGNITVTSDNSYLTMGVPGNGAAVGGRYISIEGNTGTDGEGSGRIFFTEHNSTTAAMDNYGFSIGYRGGDTAIVGASGNTWNGLADIANGQWGMWGHNADPDGALIMYGDRAATFVNFSGNYLSGIGYLQIGSTTVIDASRNLTNIGTINGYTISNWYTQGSSHITLSNQELTLAPAAYSLWLDANDADAPSSLGNYTGDYPLGIFVNGDNGTSGGTLGSGAVQVYHTGHFSGTNISNWQTAYGWGDHSTAGYLTSESDTLATVTGRGATTGVVTSFTNGTNSLGSTGGAVRITGGLGVGYNIYAGLIISAGGGFRVGATSAAAVEVIDSSRNLVNIGTISSGAITSTGSSRFSAANNYFGGTTANTAEIIMQTGNGGSPQIVFTDNQGDMTWSMGGDDGDNHFKLHGNYSSTITAINNLTVPQFEWQNTGDFIAQGNITAYSDKKLKKNILVIENAMKKVQQLSGITYEKIYEEANTRYTGVIAQEVEKVLPEAVINQDNGYKTVAYGNMVGLLIEAIKEQQTQIEELKAQVQSLKEK